MDEFDLEVKIRELELAYERAVVGMRDARMRVEILRNDPRSRMTDIAAAEARCGELARRKEIVRARLEQLEEGAAPVRPAARALREARTP